MYVNENSEDFAAFQDFLKKLSIEICSPHESNRVNHASVLLLWNSEPPKRVKRFVEIGCGSGFVSFGLAKLYNLKGIGVDIQSELKKNFEEGACLNGVENQLGFLGMDISDTRQQFEPESYDMCVFNPPHYITGRGERVRDKLRGLSRTADDSLFECYSNSISYLLKTRGMFSCVIAPNNLEEWMLSFLRHQLYVKEMIPIYGNPQNDAQLLLIRGIKNSKSSFVKFKPAVFLK